MRLEQVLGMRGVGTRQTRHAGARDQGEWKGLRSSEKMRQDRAKQVTFGPLAVLPNLDFTQAPPLLLALLRPGTFFKRRALLQASGERAHLLCCSVSLIEAPSEMPNTRSRKYESCVLYEDVLSSDACSEFVHAIDQGHADFGETRVMREVPAQWSQQHVAAENTYMPDTGHVITARFGTSGGFPSAPLVSASEPYYPDLDHAGREWLGFPTYYGRNDGRNYQIHFLIPEKRAFVARAEFTAREVLQIDVVGALVGAHALCIKGAYWLDKDMYHFEAPVSGGLVNLTVPAHADRIDFVLLDENSQVFDYHREDRYFAAASGRRILGLAIWSREERVRDALQMGEGPRTEFKPYVSPDQPLGTVRQPTKLREVVETVVAFSNTSGGTIYLGIEDDGTLTGIEDDLRRVERAEVTDGMITRFLTEMRNRIRDAVHGDVQMEVTAARTDGALIGLIEVAQSAGGDALAIKQDSHLYMRRGASNTKVPPNEWHLVLKDRLGQA
jgi:hypothetical protein